MQNPTILHWNAVARLIAYAIQAKELGLVLGETESLIVPMVYVDADWAGDLEICMSMNAFVELMGGSAVLWCAFQKLVVSVPFADSEYISI